MTPVNRIWMVAVFGIYGWPRSPGASPFDGARVGVRQMVAIGPRPADRRQSADAEIIKDQLVTIGVSRRSGVRAQTPLRR
jgi:hypothetical protein